MSNEQNHVGDVLLHIKINDLCDRIDKSKPQKLSNLPTIIEEALNIITGREIYITKKFNTASRREFPKFDSRGKTTIISYYETKNASEENLKDDFLNQWSIAAVLACCSVTFVDELPADATIRFFYQKWPEHFNLATKIRDFLCNKIE